MESPVISSTFFLTLLMMIGLVFFIRASTKERIEVVQLAIAQAPDFCMDQLQSYFIQRSYELVDAESTNDKRTFEGFVRPSIFLAILLFILAGIGCLCLGLVLSILLSQWNPFVWAITLLAPGASIFYWKKSARREQVSFKVEAMESSPSPVSLVSPLSQTKVTVRGHRDELASLQVALAQQSLTVQVLESNQ